MFLLLLMSYSMRSRLASTILEAPQELKAPSEPAHPPEDIKPKQPTYKPEHTSNVPPITDNFPFAAAAHSSADLPPIPPWNRPRSPHVPEQTPLFIGFTRNWALLQQTVVSWITAGWPPSDIYVVENTGTMRSNELGLLSLQNPFFLNHTRLHMFGVNILVNLPSSPSPNYKTFISGRRLRGISRLTFGGIWMSSRSHSKIDTKGSDIWGWKMTIRIFIQSTLSPLTRYRKLLLPRRIPMLQIRRNPGLRGSSPTIVLHL